MIQDLENKVKLNEYYNDKFLGLIKSNEYLSYNEKNYFSKYSSINDSFSDFSDIASDYYEKKEELSELEEYQKMEIKEYEYELDRTLKLLLEISDDIDSEVNSLGSDIYLDFFKDIIENHIPPEKYVKWWGGK